MRGQEVVEEFTEVYEGLRGAYPSEAALAIAGATWLVENVTDKESRDRFYATIHTAPPAIQTERLILRGETDILPSLHSRARRAFDEYDSGNIEAGNGILSRLEPRQSHETIVDGAVWRVALALLQKGHSPEAVLPLHEFEPGEMSLVLAHLCSRGYGPAFEAAHERFVSFNTYAKYHATGWDDFPKVPSVRYAHDALQHGQNDIARLMLGHMIEHWQIVDVLPNVVATSLRDGTASLPEDFRSMSNYELALAVVKQITPSTMQYASNLEERIVQAEKQGAHYQRIILSRLFGFAAANGHVAEAISLRSRLSPQTSISPDYDQLSIAAAALIGGNAEAGISYFQNHVVGTNNRNMFINTVLEKLPAAGRSKEALLLAVGAYEGEDRVGRYAGNMLARVVMAAQAA